jgi:nucleoside-diphosphate-sugar epimerase
MKILIIGAAGMIGRKLTERLLADAHLNTQNISKLLLADVVEPTIPENPSLSVQSLIADLTAPGAANKLIQDKPDVIYHLAAIVSGEAEANFDKGYLINMDGTRALLDAIRKQHDIDDYTPKLIFTSSIAVYGAPFPSVIDDEFHQTPLTSYGTQKAICELLLADCNRRGILQGIGLRLPTICIRPGLPNKAASGFFSNILREPINGSTAVLPVDESVRHWFASPRAAINFLVHAASLTPSDVGDRCNMNLPGLSVTVAEQIDSLRSVVGSDAVNLIQRQHDPVIKSIVANWPRSFDAKRAIELGFSAEKSFDDIINVYLEDELGK